MTICHMPWTKVEQQFEEDDKIACLCDIVVPEAEPGDWQRVLDLLREREIAWQVGYVEDDERAQVIIAHPSSQIGHLTPASGQRSLNAANAWR